MAPETAQRLADKCEDYQVLYLRYFRRKHTLTIMGGFDAAMPVLNSISENVNLGEEAGGSAMKSVNQLLAGIHIAAMGEALTFGISGIAGIVEVISGYKPMFENRGANVVDGDYTPYSAINIWLKDLGIVLDVAKASQFSASLTAAAFQQFWPQLGRA